MRFADIKGKQTYRMLWGGGTHFANPNDDPDAKNYCQRGSGHPGQIYCVNYTDSRF